MTTTETDSPPTSELKFVDSFGIATGVPSEWTPGLFAVAAEPSELGEVRVTINGRPAEVVVRTTQGASHVIASWPRAGPGWYEVVSSSPGSLERHRIRISPAKIGEEAFGDMLEDLEFRLPVSLALALKDAGARVGWAYTPPAQQTLASEVARLRRAVVGIRARPGLKQLLEEIGSHPHRMLRNVGEWVRRERVRRPDPAGLVRALWRAGNLESRLPLNVIDRRVEHNVDLYENRIVRAYATEVELRLRRLRGVLEGRSDTELEDEVDGLLAAMVRARRAATFLDDVGPLRVSPGRVTMVLLKRKDYRALYEGFLDFRRRMAVQLNDPTIAEPLKNLPHLYQVWGTLLAMEAVLEVAVGAGFRVHQQRLIWPQAGGLYVSVLADGRAALDLKHPDGRRLRFYPERSYSPGGTPLGSISFKQRPDIAVELEQPDGQRSVVVLDPKYKLASEEGAEPGDGTPKKVDVDKMHAYRDAIRDASGRRVVRYAATLYPGGSRSYGKVIGAIRMYPGEEAEMQAKVRKEVQALLEG